MGFGGVNSHAVVEEFIPAAAPSSGMKASSLPLPMILSAHSEKSLHELVGQWSKFLFPYQGNRAVLEHISYTLLAGRNHLSYRTGIMISSVDSQSTSITFPLAAVAKSTKPVGFMLSDMAESSLEDLQPLVEFLYDPEGMQHNMPTGDGKYDALLATNICTAFLIKMGIQPHVMVGSGRGQLSAYAQAHMIDDGQLFQLREFEKASFTAKRPKWPIFDLTSRKIVHAISLDREACEKTRLMFLNFENLERPLLDAVSNMVNDQMVLKRYLMTLDSLLKELGVDIFKVIDKKQAEKKSSGIINLVLLAALEHLCSKYQINNFVKSENDFLNEIGRLISEDLIQLKEFVHAVGDENQFRHLMEKVCAHHKFRNQPQSVLFHQNDMVVDFDIHHKIDSEVLNSLRDYRLIHIGAGQDISTLNSMMLLLIELWMEGYDIQWHLLAAKCFRPHIQDLDLPAYVFDSASFVYKK
jgi:hypothetical protein